MIEIDIPSIDPLNHEPKIFVGMTARQCKCILPGGLLAIGAFMLTKNISMDVATLASIITVTPFVLFGWLKMYNMKLEDYLKLWYYNNFVSSPERIAKTDSEEPVKTLTLKEREIIEKKKKESELQKKKDKKKKDLENRKEQ